MKPSFRTGFYVKSLSFLMSLRPGVDIADVAGKRWEILIPANGLPFDGETTPGFFYAVYSPQFGNSTTPRPALVRLAAAGNHVLFGSDATNPRQAVISRLVAELEIFEGAAAFEDIPLIFKGANTATNAPESISLPSFSADPDAPFVVKDSSGGIVGITASQLNVIGSGGGGYTLSDIQSLVLNSILTDADGNVMSNADGNVLFVPL